MTLAACQAASLCRAVTNPSHLRLDTHDPIRCRSLGSSTGASRYARSRAFYGLHRPRTIASPRLPEMKETTWNIH